MFGLILLLALNVCSQHSVNENWNTWGAWSTCSRTCGSGTKTRSRTCSSSCSGDSIREMTSCSITTCPVNGNWGVWGAWSSCSTTCGGDGILTRHRFCNNPDPAHGGTDCPGGNRTFNSCFIRPCPVNENWNTWGAWGTCSRTCGSGTKTRSRTCFSSCSGDSIREMTSCSITTCPVNGNWGVWGAWSSCSTTCGGDGILTRHRFCNNPDPAHGGTDCPGGNRTFNSCFIRPCPVNENWNTWGAWGTCSRTCGSGTKTRSRTCFSSCSGDSIREMTSCSITTCPVNGNWGVWGAWSSCSTTCGGDGILTRHRFCNNPDPAHGGTDCPGSNLNGEWSEWGTCSRTCGSGTKTRSRTCSSSCSGDNIWEMTSCYITPCPVNGNWGVWGAWSSCSTTCGGDGMLTRHRFCNNPNPAHGGTNCPGSIRTFNSCFIRPCPVNGNWGIWEPWGTCTTTCNDGIWKRNRPCDNPAPAHGGSDCQGSNNSMTTCYTTCPAVNGKWGTWGDWSSCTTTCGGGLLIRYRPCDNPPPENAGLYCLGRSDEKEACSTLPCPVSRDNTGSMAIGIGLTAVFIGLLIIFVHALKWHKLKKPEENTCAVNDITQTRRSYNSDLHVYSELQHDTSLETDCDENTCTLYDRTDARRSTNSDIHAYSGLEHDTKQQTDCEPPTQRNNDGIYINMTI